MSDTDGHGGRPHGLLAALVLADIAFAFQQTAIVPAVQAVRSDLGASQEWSSWLITVYLMIATAATPAMGRLADLYGRRRLLAVGLVVFGIGSVGAALAPGIGALVGFRAVQGIGGAVYPATLALARQSVRDDRVSAVVALVAGAFGAGTVLGFACGGVLADYLSWRAVFAAGALGVGVGLAAVARYVPRFDPVGHGCFDAWGTVTLAAASSSLLAALTLVVSIGPAQPRTIGLFVLAAGSAVAWLALQWRRDDPLVDLRAMAKWSIV
jgi:MFS family permease